MAGASGAARLAWRGVLSIGFFIDKARQPTPAEVGEVLGEKLPLWNDLVRLLSGGYGAEGEFRFYGRHYGWALRFRKSGRALLSMYPGKGFFTVQIVLNPTQAEEAMRLRLGQRVSGTLETAREYPEGRWLYIRVASNRDAQDIQHLLSLKAGPMKHRARGSLG